MTWLLLLLLLPDHEAEVGGTADISLKPLTYRNKEKAGHIQATRHGKAQLRLHPKEDSALVGEKSTAVEVVVKLPCSREVGRCLPEDGVELEMNSEENRRLLWTVTEKKYISYEALKGDVVPCSKPGVPYYNCRSFPKANPYSRGCQIISGCRGDSP
ncbi:Rapid ALkalinization Factor (RALF) [Musa troglodytarum]|uniref:Rapid ALkalinization Factor (RALF) n=1 Tax=Musa troglodytarum TaxID=320322 RepID=A0A9E7FDN0_9LILI|nr:Rapid ALkalinization Factor (RALF) [Musa troglodytarum]